jgi:hypothetical protein
MLPKGRRGCKPQVVDEVTSDKKGSIQVMAHGSVYKGLKTNWQRTWEKRSQEILKALINIHITTLGMANRILRALLLVS